MVLSERIPWLIWSLPQTFVVVMENAGLACLIFRSPFSKYLDRFQAHCGASPAGSYQSHKVNTKLLV